MRSLSGATPGLSSRWIVSAVVAAGLFLAGIAVALAVGPALAPQDAPPEPVFDFYGGWTVGLALVIVWAVARLRPSQPPGLEASLALVAAIFYVGLTGGTYLAAGSSLAYVIGLVVAVVLSLFGGVSLHRTGRLDGRAIGPGMLLGAGVMLLGWNLYLLLWYTVAYAH